MRHRENLLVSSIDTADTIEYKMFHDKQSDKACLRMRLGVILESVSSISNT